MKVDTLTKGNYYTTYYTTYYEKKELLCLNCKYAVKNIGKHQAHLNIRCDKFNNIEAVIKKGHCKDYIYEE